MEPDRYYFQFIEGKDTTVQVLTERKHYAFIGHIDGAVTQYIVKVYKGKDKKEIEDITIVISDTLVSFIKNPYVDTDEFRKSVLPILYDRRARYLVDRRDIDDIKQYLGMQDLYVIRSYSNGEIIRRLTDIKFSEFQYVGEDEQCYTSYKVARSTYLYNTYLQHPKWDTYEKKVAKRETKARAADKGDTPRSGRLEDPEVVELLTEGLKSYGKGRYLVAVTSRSRHGGGDRWDAVRLMNDAGVRKMEIMYLDDAARKQAHIRHALIFPLEDGYEVLMEGVRVPRCMRIAVIENGQ